MRLLDELFQAGWARGREGGKTGAADAARGGRRAARAARQARFEGLEQRKMLAVLAAADFTTYADGALVGQNGWQQYQTQTDVPLTVSGGRVAWAGGATVNNQDAFLPFAEQVAQPVAGSTVLNLDMVLNVTAPSASNPSYFAALNTLTTSTTSGNFQNARLVAQSSGSGFVFGARVNGQSGYPFVYGTEVLTVGQDYALRAEINMVAGNANDFINLYVGPDFDNLTLHATAGYGSGTVSDPSFGAMLLSQFGSASVSESGVSVQSMSVTRAADPAFEGMVISGLPTTITELDYDIVGTIAIAEALEADLQITLTSSNPDELLVYNDISLPAASTVVTIPAGQTSAGFFIEGVPDDAVDGDIAVTLTATAPGFAPAEATVTVVNVDIAPASFTAEGYTQDFATFAFETPDLPLGWSGRGDVTSFPDPPVETDNNTGEDVSQVLWGSGFRAGYRGGASLFGYQHTGSTGTFEKVLALRNDTEETITELTIAYTGRVERVTEARHPAYTVTVAGNIVESLAYSTGEGADAARSVSLSSLSIAPGEIFQIVWSSDRGSNTTGSSRQIGISDVSVALGFVQTPPAVARLSIPAPTLGPNSAVATATVTSDGGDPLTAAGFVYIATAELDGELTLDTDGAVNVSAIPADAGQMSETLSGLTVGTPYTIRAYATNSLGISYSAAQTFTTLSPVSLSGLYTQDFAGFAGSLPNGWSVASTENVLTYIGAWGSGTAGGIRGAGESTGGVLGYQHTGSTGTFTVSLAMVNDTGAPIESLDVSYLGRVARADQARPPEWTVSIDGVTAEDLAYSTNNTAGEAGAAGDETISATVTGLSIGVGEAFTIRWASDRGESDTGGSSRQIGIGDVSVSVEGGQPATPTITPSGVPTTDPLRIVTYNIAASQGSGLPRSGLDTILAAISSETFAGRTDRIDVLALQEVQSQATTTAAVVSLLNGLYGAGTYGRGTLNGSGQYTVGVVYDTASLTLVEEVAVTTGGPRQTIRYRFEPVAGSAADGFYLYNSHLKAQADSTSEATRAVEAAAIRADADALGDGVSILYVGDFNLYTSNEGAFQEFVSAGHGQAFDPINSPGNWSGSSSFRGIFTQAPSATGSGELVGGGLDDRFDFQLVSGEVLDGTGFDYLANSYRAFGNNGSVAVNSSINSGTNTALAGLPNRLQVLDLLTTVSDHLPVVADYTMPTSQGLTALSTTAGTPSAASSFVVSAADLTGDLTISAPAGFELSLAESTGYTAAGLVLSPTAGTVAATTVYIRLAATATAGSYTGNVSFASDGAQTQSLAIPTSTVTGGTEPVDPVNVTGVFVRGSAWNAGYLGRTPFTTLDGASLGWQLPDGSAQLANSSNVSWNNVDVIAIRFDQSIAQPAADALQLVLGTAVGNETILPAAAPTLLAGGTVAEWTLPATLATGRYVISIAAAGITNAAGTATLDGEWTTSSSTFTTGSGDGSEGGTFNFFFNALVGDVNGDGIMNAGDLSAIRSALASPLNTTLAADSSNYRLDVDGLNSLNSADLSKTRAQLSSALGTRLSSLPAVAAPEESGPRSSEAFAALAEESEGKLASGLSTDAWAWYGIETSSKDEAKKS